MVAQGGYTYVHTRVITIPAGKFLFSKIDYHRFIRFVYSLA
jgi:hypothetical protein